MIDSMTKLQRLKLLRHAWRGPQDAAAGATASPLSASPFRPKTTCYDTGNKRFLAAVTRYAARFERVRIAIAPAPARRVPHAHI